MTKSCEGSYISYPQYKVKPDSDDMNRIIFVHNRIKSYHYVIRNVSIYGTYSEHVYHICSFWYFYGDDIDVVSMLSTLLWR